MIKYVRLELLQLTKDRIQPTIMRANVFQVEVGRLTMYTSQPRLKTSLSKLQTVSA